MSTAVQRRRGTTAQHAAFTGLVGESTYNTDVKILVAHDGATVGGFPAAHLHVGNIFSQPQTISVLSGAPTIAFDILVDGLSRFQARKTGYVAVLRQEADTSPSSFELSKRGTTGNALAALSNGSGIGSMYFRGHDGTAFGDAGSVQTTATQAWAVGTHGSQLVFRTVPAGSATETTHATLNSTELSVTSRLLLPNTTSATVGGIYFGGNRAFHNFGTNNIFAGVNAGNFTMTGTANSFFGVSSGAANTTGTFNSFFGRNAGLANTTGNLNSFFGTYNGRANTTGNLNSFFGTYTGRANTTGSANSFFGTYAGRANTTGTLNSFFGVNAGLGNTTGLSNSFFGAYAGQNNTTGPFNAFFGRNTGFGNTTGVSNSFFGAAAGQANTTGSANSFFGRNTGLANTTGSANSFFGTYAGQANTTGNFNTFFGNYSGRANTTGANNSFFGRYSGQLNTTGNNNTFFGFQAGNNLTTGSNNIALGYDIDSPTATNSNTLTIGNLIFGTGIDGTGTTISSGNVGIGVITALDKLHVDGRLRVNTGFFNDAGGFKHARVTTGSVGAGTTALVTITWATAFADTNYTVNASVLDATTSSLSLSVVHIETITAAAVTVRVLNNAIGSLTGTVHVIAVHD